MIEAFAVVPPMSDAQRVGGADGAGQGGGGDDAGRGSRLDHVHWALPPALGGHDAAVGLHDEQRRSGVQGAQLGLERGEVAVHHRHHVSVGDRGARALELPHLGQDLGRQGEGHVRRALADHRAHLGLVGRVGVGVQEADRDRLHALGEQAVDGGGAVAVQRGHHLTAVIHALADLAPPPARHQRSRAFEVEVVEPRELQTADLEQVAKTLRGEQARPRAAPLQDRVRGHRGAVNDLADVAGCDAGLGGQVADARDDRLGVVRGGRQHFAGAGDAVGRHQDQIGEGAAHVHSQPVAHADLPRPASPRGTKMTNTTITKPTAIRLYTTPTKRKPS
jgi:hypothetical protein